MKVLAGKVTVVTGAGSGIGRQLAIQLAAAGARVAVVDRSEKGATATAAALRDAGAACESYVVDVSNATAVDLLASSVQADLGPCDILINNAGVMLGSDRFDRVSADDVEWVVGVNLWGVIHCTRAFLPQLLSRSEAAIVNVSSLAGLVGFVDQVAYATTKFAVRGFSESLQMDLLDTGISVTAVYPGAVATAIVGSIPGFTAEHWAALKRRAPGSPAVSAEAAARMIIGGVRRKAARVLISREAKVIDIIVRLAPGRYSRLLRPRVKQLTDMARISAR